MAYLSRVLLVFVLLGLWAGSEEPFALNKRPASYREAIPEINIRLPKSRPAKETVALVEAELKRVAKDDPCRKLLEEDLLYFGMRARTLGRVQKLLFGGFYVIGTEVSPGGDDIHVLPTKAGGLEIVVAAGHANATVCAQVAPDGKIAYLDKEGNKASQLKPGDPQQWPSNGKNAALTLPPPNSFILRKKTATEKSGTKPKEGIIWAFFNEKGDLQTPYSYDDPPIDNVVWLHRNKDRGLTLEHSGPLYSGVYAHVSPDRVMTYVNPVLDPPKGKTFFWNFRTKDNYPALLPDYCYLRVYEETRDDNMYFYEDTGDIADWNVRIAE